MDRKDIQSELKELCADMDSSNIYSQLTYFLIEIAFNKENPRNSGHELSCLLGLLSDSYYGKLAMGSYEEFKEGGE